MTSTALSPGPDAVTDDAFLGGALRILQPKSGYRAGVDAVLLAAALPAADKPVRVLDLGSGVGTVGLAVAKRCPNVSVVLFEREPLLARLARENVARNGLAERVGVAEGDVAAISPAELAVLGLGDESFDVALCNPPFHDEANGTGSANPLKAGAHAMGRDGMDQWVRFLARMTKPGGTALVVHLAEALPKLLSALEGRFGGLDILPIHARAGEPAIRVIAKGVKGSKAPPRLLAGFVLHEADGAFTAAAQDILRHGGALKPASA